MGRENLKKSQGEASTYPRIEPKFTLSVVKTEDGKPSFRYYHNEGDHFTQEKIRGIFIGSAFRLTAFSDDIGKKGGNYFSDYYLSNKRIVLFMPGPGGVRVAGKGSLVDIEKHLVSEGAAAVKKRRILFVLIEKHGLVAIETNMTISIDQLKEFPKGTFLDFQMVLTPCVYFEGDPNVSKRAIDLLGRFIKKNPPNYALIEKGDPLTDEFYAKLNGDMYVEQYAVWRNHILSETPGAEIHVEDDDTETVATSNEQAPPNDNVPPDEEPEDDLPF